MPHTLKTFLLVLLTTAACGADPTQPNVGKAMLATSFAPVVKQVAPSVVTVFSSHTVQGISLPRGMADNGQLPGFLFGSPGHERPHTEQGLGSGVIVSPDGYILTNNHVVEKADEVKVRLIGSNEEYLAKVVGTDTKTDLAVLKIDPAGKSLPAASFADSDLIAVGDLALAIGNPFGVGQTVTMGIISAVGRGVGIADYEDFLQTDASINPGNSGGALVDTSGRVMGINTAIYSPNGGNLGIGFAVPANLAHTVMDSIITKGKVVRGFLGLMLQPLSPEMAKAFKLANDHGALVGDVVADGPSAKAGIKAGDVITAFNDAPISDARRLRLLVAQTVPGAKVKLTVIRDGAEQKIEVTLMDQADAKLANGEGSPADAEEAPKATLGLKFGDLSDAVRNRFSIPAKVEGAVVDEVLPESRAAAAGLKEGDVVLEIDRKPITSSKAVLLAIHDHKGDHPLLLRVWSGNGSRYVMVKMKD